MDFVMIQLPLENNLKKCGTSMVIIKKNAESLTVDCGIRHRKAISNHRYNTSQLRSKN